MADAALATVVIVASVAVRTISWKVFPVFPFGDSAHEVKPCGTAIRCYQVDDVATARMTCTSPQRTDMRQPRMM